MPIKYQKKTRPPSQVWKRRADETPRKYQFFSHYLTTEDRTIRKIADRFAVQYNYVRQISVRYHWRERAKAYDEYRMKLATLESGAIEPIITDWKQVYEADRAELWALRRQLLDQAKAILDYEITTKERSKRKIIRDEKTGEIKEIRTVVYRAPRWTVKDAAAAVKVAREITEYTLNMPSDVIEMIPQFVKALRSQDHDPVQFMRRIIDLANAS